jgi:hypothetical protein
LKKAFCVLVAFLMNLRRFAAQRDNLGFVRVSSTGSRGHPETGIIASQGWPVPIDRSNGYHHQQLHQREPVHLIPLSIPVHISTAG